MPQSAVVLSARERLIVALDVPTLDDAKRLAEKLCNHVGQFKIGLELYSRYGVEVFSALNQFGRPIFFDCKFLDIPNTVAQASRQLVGRDIFMFNVHATGGAAMLKATAQAVRDQSQKMNIAAPKVIAVTVLTSLGDAALKDELGWNIPVESAVERLAKLAKDSGIDGVVASPLEAQRIRELCGRDFLIVTPGVRPQWAGADDQVKAATPAQAVTNGADYIVVGRPITKHENPADAACRIVDEVESRK